MNNRDFLVRLKKTDRDGGDYLSWVVWPTTNKQDVPSVVEAFDINKSYDAGTFINYEGNLFKAIANVPQGDWKPALWESAEGYEAYITPHSDRVNYGPDAVVYDSEGRLWYNRDGAAAGAFAIQGWTQITPEEEIQSAVAYLDPNSAIEIPRVVRGSFVDVEKTAADLLQYAISFYDASDRYTLFQDVAGSVPVTKPGQYVRYVQDQIGDNHIVINAVTPPVYREDDNGRGYLENPAGTNFAVNKAGDTTATQLYLSIPNTGVICSEMGSLDQGFNAKPSVHASVPFTQAVVLDVTTDPLDVEVVVNELERFADRYDNRVFTSMENFFREMIPTYSFVSDSVNMRYITSIKGMFRDTEVNETLSKFDVSHVQDFSETFMGATGTIDIATWNTASATSMDSMFEACPVFNASIAMMDVSNVRSARRMFAETATFNQALPNAEWSELLYADEMFRAAAMFNRDVSSLKAPKLVSANGFLRDAVTFNQITTLTLPALTTIQSFFEGCSLLATDITVNAPNLVNISGFMRGNADFNGRVQFSSKVIRVADEAFMGCARFNGNLGLIMTELVSATSMMDGCASFNQPLTIAPDTLENGSRMFAGCTSLTFMPFTSLFFESAKNIDRMFLDCGAITTAIDVHAPFADSLESMFENCIALSGAINVNARNAITLKSMFKGCSALNGVVTMDLYRCETIESLFEECLALNSSVTINAPRLRSVKAAFRGCDMFSSDMNISTALVTDWTSFLENALTWNAVVQLDMTSMTTAGAFFKGAVAFNSDIGNFPLNEVQDLTEFLSGATAFDQDISSMCVESHPVMPANFVTADMPFFTETAKHPQWGAACA